jgi:hypothetical protein
MRMYEENLRKSQVKFACEHERNSQYVIILRYIL